MSKIKWIALVVVVVAAIFIIQDRIAYSSARSNALEGCANDFDAQFGGDHQSNLEECEAIFAEQGR